MINETIKIGNQATLKTYVWDDSCELSVISRPAVLVLPGGGYMMCSDREAEPIALAYASEGFNTFVLRYTTMCEFKVPFDEALKALALIRENAEKWHIASNKIAVCGFSAGGHLACALGSMASHKPNAMILGYPAVIGKDWEKLNPDIPDLVEKVDEKTCPAFIVSCVDDITVPIHNSIRLMAALDKFRIPFESHIFRAGGHGFSLAKKLTAAGDEPMINNRVAEWLQLSVSWLKETIGDIEMKEKTIFPENVSSAIYNIIDDMLINPKTRQVLLKYSAAFENNKILAMAGKAPVAAIVIPLGLSSEEIVKLSFDLEAVLKQ